VVDDDAEKRGTTMNAPEMPDDVLRELEEVVARIKARGPGEPLRAANPEAVAAWMEHVRSDPPYSAREMAEAEREIQAVEASMRAVERADSRRDRSL
jgi:hypothetical protein